MWNFGLKIYVLGPTYVISIACNMMLLQVVFLQQQMSDKDRTIHLLQQQMSKYCNGGRTEGEAEDTTDVAASASPTDFPSTNVATQTERVSWLGPIKCNQVWIWSTDFQVRPLSTGAALSQSYPSEGGPLVR